MAYDLREEQVRRNVEAVRGRIAAALARAGDPLRNVTLVGVTKSAPAPAVEALAAAGVRDVGENRVQEAAGKIPLVRAALRWHLIGHLQTNKARLAASLFAVVHSVDSERLLAALRGAGRPLDLFLQVNVSGEPSKSGVAPSEARALWRSALAAAPLRPTGLMTIAPNSGDPEEARPVFRALRELRDELNRSGDGPPLAHLSMGMSGDFDVAVEEGATFVRVGSALLGPIRDRHV